MSEVETVLVNYFEDFSQNSIFENLTSLKAVFDEFKSTPKDFESAISVEIEKLTQILLDNHRCPMCGCELENIVDKSRETYVPYGDTSVPLGTGYRTVCSHCGYEVED